MTYSIAAPLLYKEVVVKNLTRFFLGVDDPARPHHPSCITHRSIQPHLCHQLRKKDGSPYICYRHRDYLVPTTAFAFHHKRELLAKVEALHFCPWADEDICDDIDSADSTDSTDSTDCLSEDGEHVAPAKVCDCQRHEVVPECTKDVMGLINPLPALKRASVDRWTKDAHWTMNHILDNIPTICRISETDPTTISSVCRAFEDRLTDNIPRIRCRFLCRHIGDGPSPIYPCEIPGDVELNILHDLDFDEFYAHLVVGATNIVPIVSKDHITAIGWIEEMYVTIAIDLSCIVEYWTDLYTLDVIGRTFIRYVVERDENDHRPEAVNDLTRGMVQILEQTLASFFTVPRDLEVGLDVCWADEEGDCPACQPDTCHPAYKTDSVCNHLSRQEYDQRQKA
jgi:hypothetical protein